MYVGLLARYGACGSKVRVSLYILICYQKDSVDELEGTAGYFAIAVL